MTTCEPTTRGESQGDFDGLCGVYAIINALCVLCPEIDDEIAEVLFGHIVRAMGQEVEQPLPALAYGISQDGVRRLLRKALGFIRKNLEITIEVKELEEPARKPDLGKVWRSIAAQLDAGQVAILMTRGVQWHWTVACAATNSTLRLVDSKERKVLLRSRCTLKPTRTRFQLVPGDIIFLQRAS